jgi:UDP-N-acetylglucosamine 2-epimerase (non-hydrolysing)
MKKYAVVVGARPNYMKAAPLFQFCKKNPKVKLILINSGQHYSDNMSKIFLTELGMPKPNFSFDIQKYDKFGNSTKYAKNINNFTNHFKKNNYDGVIVFGDVNTTLAAGLASIKHSLKLIHVEAGLRSRDLGMPEEINRITVDHISDLLLTSEEGADKNLYFEGIQKKGVKFVGNLMIENLINNLEKIKNSTIDEKLGVEAGKFILVTIHRQENLVNLDTLEKLINIITKISSKSKIVFPLHPNTKNKILNIKNGKNFLEEKKIIFIEPLGYIDFISLVEKSVGVLTDSGGIQEETSFLGVPCATLRTSTERPITISMGTNKLFSVNDDPDKMIEHLFSGKKNTNIKNWDSNVSKRIFKLL